MQSKFSLRKPKEQLEKLNRKSFNHTVQKANIYDLVKKSVRKSFKVFEAYENQEDNVRFAGHCLSFLEKYFPDELNDLDFNLEYDNLQTFTGALVHLINKNHYIIKFDLDEENPEQPSTQFLKRIYFDERWYNFQVNDINLIDDEIIRIGFAHMLKKIDWYSDRHSFLTSTYKDSSKTPFWWDLIEITENKKEINDYLKSSRKLLRLYKKYLKKPFSKFENYQPKNEKNIQLKSLIDQMLDIGFSHFVNYADSYDIQEDCGVSYSDFLIVLLDMNSDLEKSYLHDNEKMAMELGIGEPCSVISVSNDQIIEYHTEEEILEFEKLQNLIYDFGDLINENTNDATTEIHS